MLEEMTDSILDMDTVVMTSWKDYTKTILAKTKSTILTHKTSKESMEKFWYPRIELRLKVYWSLLSKDSWTWMKTTLYGKMVLS